MAITAQMVKELREKTGAGVMDCKKALEETGGDMEKAANILREKSLAAAAKKVERKATDGRIEPYVHPGNKLATLVEVNCETDFVARTPEFIAFCHDLAMQVAAANPRWVSRDEIPAEVLEAEKANFMREIPADKPTAAVEQILEGKLKKFYQENVLLDQAFIKDESKTIQQLLVEAIAKLGENIVIKRFSRFQIE